MNSILLSILEHAFWCSCASLGFAILFTTPRRALLYITLGGFVAGFIKFLIISEWVGGGVVSATMAAASVIGFASIFIAHWSHVTPTIISISAVISFIPGSFAFKTMMGLIKFIRHTEAEVLVETVHNATMTFFIILAIAMGVTLPMLLLKIESVKNVRFVMRRKK